MEQLPSGWARLFHRTETPSAIEFILAPHPGIDTQSSNLTLFGNRIEVGSNGKVTLTGRKGCRWLPSDIPVRSPGLGNGNASYFFLSYGPRLNSHNQTDDFDFMDPYFRLRRFSSLFDNRTRLTDPVAFLARLHYRAVKWKRLSAQRTLEDLCRVFHEYLGCATTSWLEPECDFSKLWSCLDPWMRRAVLPALDAARHLRDAYPKHLEPLHMPGLILLYRPDAYCPPGHFHKWIAMMDALFPHMQFIVAPDASSMGSFSQPIRDKWLPVPSPAKPPEKRGERRKVTADVLLLDIDSRIPNLALMKLSRYFKSRGQTVILGRKECYWPDVERVYASCVFHCAPSQKRLRRVREYYGNDLVLGGSGVDLFTRLPDGIEDVPADYSLYPELGDRAVGFLTRGCPFSCPFCIVPHKEGATRQVGDLDDLLEKGRREKLILLDDNILSHPRADDLLEDMARRGLMVNFNQTLDIRLLDQDLARVLRRIQCSNISFTRSNYYFSLNDTHYLEKVSRHYAMLNFTTRDNVEFVFMYGFDTTLAEDVERFRFLRSLPGAYVFVQEYQPFPGGPAPIVEAFFDDKADELIDELVRIMFPQNMKSVEKYYRWLSNRYVETFGKLHPRLVDYIFRYNNRDKKGIYIQTLAGTKALCEG